MSGITTTAMMRIKKEISMCEENNNSEIEIIPCVNDNVFIWKAYIMPPVTSIYHNTRFELSIKIPETYPCAPPVVMFVDKIFHPNISHTGAICISTLGKDWSPALTIEKLLYGILSMLDDPNPYDPLCPDAAELYISDKRAYRNKVRSLCKNARIQYNEPHDKNI